VRRQWRGDDELLQRVPIEVRRSQLEKRQDIAGRANSE